VNIPEEAIQAGAAAVGRMGKFPIESTWADITERTARAVLEVAAPLIAAQVLRQHAQDLEDGCEEEIRGMDGGFVDGYRAATAHAVRVLRGSDGERSQVLIDCPACLADHYGLPAGTIEHNHGPDECCCAGCIGMGPCDDDLGKERDEEDDEPDPDYEGHP
jgi:hypothetical protein